MVSYYVVVNHMLCIKLCHARKFHLTENVHTRDQDTDRHCTHAQLVVLRLPLYCRKQGWSRKRGSQSLSRIHTGKRTVSSLADTG